METMRCLLIGVFLFAASLHAETPPGRARSHVDIRLDLFGIPSPIHPDSIVGGAQQAMSSPKKKSVGLAAVYSLAIPGMGELYADNFSSGMYFLIAEGVLWLTYAAFDLTGDAIRDDARTYASAHAGAIVAGKDDQFFVDVGNFNSLADYNDKKLRDREPSKLYDPALGYAWQWDAEASRLTFRDQRVLSETMYNNRKFVIAAVLINHVASAINAARAAIAQNSALDNVLGDLRFSAGVVGSPAAPRGVTLTVIKGF